MQPLDLNGVISKGQLLWNEENAFYFHIGSTESFLYR